MKAVVKQLKEAGRRGLAAAKWVNAKVDRACEAAFPHAPQEIKNTAAGIATGFLAGAAIGGIGIAFMGGAVGVPGAAVLAVAGGFVGNRVGISKDRRGSAAAAPRSLSAASRHYRQLARPQAIKAQANPGPGVRLVDGAMARRATIQLKVHRQIVQSIPLGDADIDCLTEGLRLVTPCTPRIERLIGLLEQIRDGGRQGAGTPG